MKNTHTKSHRALILDADFVASLTILRSLSRQNIHCDIASSEKKPLNCSSRYAKKHHQYPDPLVETEAFVNFICKLLENNQYDLVIPVTERSLIPLSESTKLDSWRNHLAIAERPSLLQVLDKAKTLELAKKCDISIPFSHSICSLEEIETIADNLDYPVVIKPGQSIPDANQRRQLTVTYAHSKKDLIQKSKELLPYCQLLIQQYAQGIGTGIELLADHGEIVYAFQHRRIHELPLTGGGSCLRKSIAVDPVLLQAAKKLISSLNWHGVAMVEFKWQPETGQYWLMEINGRFWGSLPLANAAGADFPKMLFDLLVLKQRPETQNYKENIYCRKLSADLYWLELVLRKNEDDRLVIYPSKQQIFKDWVLFFHPTRHFLDVQCLTDPLPGLIDIFIILKENYQRLAELILFKALIKYHGSSFVKKRLITRLHKSKNILFLCYGNINRSALAQAIAEQSLKTEGITFCSTGFHQQDKRPADSTMVRTAIKNKIDLSNWQSTTINENLVNQADIILGMEIQHLNRLFNNYPNTKDKSYLLGSLTADQFPETEISDPYNEDDATFKQVFKRIELATKEIKKHLSANL